MEDRKRGRERKKSEREEREGERERKREEQKDRQREEERKRERNRETEGGIERETERGTGGERGWGGQDGRHCKIEIKKETAHKEDKRKTERRGKYNERVIYRKKVKGRKDLIQLFISTIYFFV